MTRVINRRNKEPYDIYIGRGTPFGNPYDYRKLGITRDECILKYHEWFYKRLTDPVFRDKVLKLKGKTLGCWCKPDACHGDVIVEYLEHADIKRNTEKRKPSGSVRYTFPEG